MGENICKKCGSILGEEAEFCSQCGTKVLAVGEEGKCPECGSDIEQAATFCPKCGMPLNVEKKRTAKKTKKIRVIVFVAILIFVLAGVVVSIISRRKEAERLAEIKNYITESQEVFELIKEAEEPLRVIGFMYNEAIDTDGGLLSTDVLINYCTSLCSNEIVKSKDLYEETEELYENIPECEEKEISDLKKELAELYECYDEYYEFLIDKTFSTINYKTGYATKQNEYKTSLSTVEELLDELTGEFLSEKEEENQI